MLGVSHYLFYMYSDEPVHNKCLSTVPYHLLLLIYEDEAVNTVLINLISILESASGRGTMQCTSYGHGENLRHFLIRNCSNEQLCIALLGKVKPDGACVYMFWRMWKLKMVGTRDALPVAGWRKFEKVGLVCSTPLGWTELVFGLNPRVDVL